MDLQEILNMFLREALNMDLREILNMVLREALNMVLREILNMVLREVLNMVLRKYIMKCDIKKQNIKINFFSSYSYSFFNFPETELYLKYNKYIKLFSPID